MRYGHSPAAIDDYALRDLRLFMTAYPTIQEIEVPLPGGAFDG